MNNEIEAHFLDVDKDDVRKRLSKLRATLVKPEALMRRTVFDLGQPNSYARVRDEGDKITMTYKRISDETSILGTKEVNIVVDDYKNAVSLLENCGLRPKSWEETYREEWKYGDVSFCIDTWPWIPTFLEIEGPDEKSVWDIAQKLGFEKENAHFGSVDSTYRHYYGIEEDVFNKETPVVNFEIEPPEWARKRIF